MKQTQLVILFLIFSTIVFAQKSSTKIYAEIDKKILLLPDSLTNSTENLASYINSNFPTENEKVRAIFKWITNNIVYDVENMYVLNFYEKKEDKISKPLKTRKGICENYAELFNDICLKSGIKSIVIEGYTKESGTVSNIPHAWNAAYIDSSWWLFDPTWGAGYAFNSRFFKKYNEDYFKAYPSVLIQSHMPFDCLNQFLNFPVSNQEFYDGKTKENKSKPYFSYLDTMLVFEKQNHIEQYIATAARIEKGGIKNSMIFDRLQHIKIEIENDRRTQIAALYNSAVSEYNNGIHTFNEFIHYKNKQFVPLKSDAEIQSMLDSTDFKISEARRKIGEIKNPDEQTSSSLADLKRTIDDLSAQSKEQQDWLKTYFAKNKTGRKSMFFVRKSIF